MSQRITGESSVFPANLGRPATSALITSGITTLKKLSTYTEAEILDLHGVGPSAIPKLRAALAEVGLSFKK